MVQPLPYSDFEIDAAVLPLATGSPNTLLRDADPVFFYIIDFYKFLIETYVGPRLLEAARAAFTTQNPIETAVAQVYPWPPALELTTNQFQFPLLAVYRKTSTYTRKTASWEEDTCSFDCVYVLPPLTAGQSEQLLPILRSVEMTLRRKTTQGYDPGYTPPGGTTGEQPWTLTLAGLDEIGFTRGHYGTWDATQDSKGLKFPFLLMEGFVRERDMYLPGEKFAGGDIQMDLVAPDLTTVPNLVSVSTQQAPTITSLSVATGPIAGGTSVTITGTLYLPVPAVLFGVTPATSVVWNSATSLTCVTPAVSGSGTLSVTVVNEDGQTVTLLNAFTYT